MFSIGALSKTTGVKIPTIRYYEQVGLITARHRTEGNQRRFGPQELERLGFIKHARELGFSIDAISSLIELSEQPDQSCSLATGIATAQLKDVQSKIARLIKLESELTRIVSGCDGAGTGSQCYVLTSLADHGLCSGEHN